LHTSIDDPPLRTQERLLDIALSMGVDHVSLSLDALFGDVLHSPIA
jgi:hypothetical protein